MDFGQVVETYHFTQLDSSRTLGGISYCGANGYFYIIDVWAREVWRFDPSDPEASLSRVSGFVLPDVFQDGYLDWHWGISWVDGVFWISCAPALLDSSAITVHDSLGTVLDTIFLDSVGAGGWFAGLDFDPNSQRVWAVNVLGTEKAYGLDVDNPNSPTDSAYQWDASQRGISFFGYGHDSPPLDTLAWLMTAGWNEDALYCLDAVDPDHEIIELVNMANAAGIDVWEDSTATDTVYAFVTLNDDSNTVNKISLGITWDQWTDTTGIREAHQQGQGTVVVGPNPSSGLVVVSGLTPGQHRITVFDVSGRLVLHRSFNGTDAVFKLEGPGAYIVRVDHQDRLLLIR